MRKTIILALLLACGTGEAADWVSLGRSNNGKIEEFVDAWSVEFDGEIRRVWTKSVLEPHWKKGDGSDANKWMSYTQSFMAFNCKAHTVRMEANTYYYDDDTLTSTPTSDLPTPWERVPPDTILDNQMHVVCGLKPR